MVGLPIPFCIISCSHPPCRVPSPTLAGRWYCSSSRPRDSRTQSGHPQDAEERAST